MKIINNKDINNLIIFSKKNLGIYKLVYKEYKNIYWMSILLTNLSIILLVSYILISNFRTNLFLEKICGICCLMTCIFSLILLYLLDKKTKSKHLKIQDCRLKKLKKYYNSNNYLTKDIIIINEQLSKRIEKIEKQKTTILIVFGILILPIWDIFIQDSFVVFSSQQFVKVVLFSIFLSFIIRMLIKVCKRGLYLYEENIYIKNNISLMENLIYLNNYIIKEEEEEKNHGRRRRRR